MTLSVFIELLGLLSVVTFVGSLLVDPWLIGQEELLVLAF